MKKFRIILVNIVLLLIVFFIADYCTFFVIKKQIGLESTYFRNMTKKIAVSDEYDSESLFSMNFRPAYNEENVGYKSIIFTGCSFVYGAGLEENQTISYKTSKLLKNPVYNLGFPSKAINTTIAAIHYGIFDSIVKVPPKTVLYNYADFHLQRLVMPNVFWEINEFLYRLNSGELERKRPPFIVSRFSILSMIRKNLHYSFLDNSKYYKNYIKNLLKAHFIEMKKLLNEKYGDFKFIILVYEKSPIFEEMASDMEKEGFIILRTYDDFGIDTRRNIFHLRDGHPNETAWDIIVPQLVKYL